MALGQPLQVGEYSSMELSKPPYLLTSNLWGRTLMVVSDSRPSYGHNGKPLLLNTASTEQTL